MSAADTTPTEPLPVTVIGGYLGTGKTTLVNHLLRHADGERLAVLVNEFGALPIDADLIEAEDDNMIAIAGGCVCCSYGNDMIMALLDLARMEPRPHRVLLEASGVALPGAIAASIGLLAPYRLDGVLVLADAETVRAKAADPYMGDTIERQLDDADLVVLNKIDLVTETALAGTRAWLAELFPSARQITARHAGLPLAIVLGALQQVDGTRQHSTARHDNQFTTRTFAVDALVEPHALAEALAEAPLGIARAKGFVPAGDGRTYEIQVVGARATCVPATDKPIGLVCIGVTGQLDSAGIAHAIDTAATSSLSCRGRRAPSR